MIPVNDLKRGFELYKDEYLSAAKEVLESGWYVLGTQVQSFEKDFADMLGARFCVGVDNGLNAISLGVRLLGIGEGDEILVQANTYIATFLGATINGATPVLVEPDGYFNINAAAIEEKITKRTKAVLVTHLYGQASDMENIVRVCKKHNLYLLEDCAQSHFATYDGKYTGTFGDMGFFSFYPTKNLGGFGDGGAVVTNNEVYNRKLRILRNYGSERKYENLVKGFNCRLDEMQAGLLRIKLRHIKELTEERTRIAGIYNKCITNLLIRKPDVLEKATHVYHLYVVRVEHREKFRAYLGNHGIGTDVHYPIPPHLSEAYKYLGWQKGSFPVAEEYAQTVVSLPLFNGMREDEIQKVIDVVNRFEI